MKIDFSPIEGDLIPFGSIDLDVYYVVGIDEHKNLFYVDNERLVKYAVCGTFLNKFTKEFAQACLSIGVFDSEEKATSFILNGCKHKEE